MKIRFNVSMIGSGKNYYCPRCGAQHYINHGGQKEYSGCECEWWTLEREEQKYNPLTGGKIDKSKIQIPLCEEGKGDIGKLRELIKHPPIEGREIEKWWEEMQCVEGFFEGIKIRDPITICDALEYWSHSRPCYTVYNRPVAIWNIGGHLVAERQPISFSRDWGERVFYPVVV